MIGQTPPIDRPDVIVPDIGPLVHLAQAGALALLHEIGRRVVVTDMVAIEATAELSKPGAADIRDWLEAGRAIGSNAPVSIETTDVGRAFQAARQTDPAFRWRRAGELSILEWLRDEVDRSERAVLIVYDNGKVPRLIGDYGIDADIDILTTRAFLELAERRHVLGSADEVWRRITDAAPTANPAITLTLHRRPQVR